MNVVEVLRTRCAVLSDLSDDERMTLVNGSTVREIHALDFAFRAGEVASAVLIVLEGCLATLVTRGWGEERALEEAEVGDLVGVVELLSGDYRLADVRALSDTQVLVVPRRLFESILGPHESIWRSVTDRARTSVYRLLTARQLGHLLGTPSESIADPLLRLRVEEEWLNFERDVLSDLEEHIDWLRLKRGEFLFRQGDKAEEAFVLVSGVLQVNIHDPLGVKRVVSEIGPGEIVGEIALFTDQDRTASLVATRDCELFRIPRKVFSQITERYPQILLNLYRTSLHRLLRNASAPAWRPRQPNTAFLRAYPDVEIGGVVQSVLEAMAAHGTVGHFTSGSVNEALGQPGISHSHSSEPANVRLVQWLNGQERQLDRIIYEADAEWSDWTDRCVRQADHVLVFVDANDSRALPDFRSRFASTGQRWSLVLLHPADTDRPRGTAAKLNSTGIGSVYHVRRGVAQDIARLARFLSGRAVSLVLGGGGARGGAHLGVIRALEELGVVVDMVAGTSMGAPIAGLLAMGHSAATCESRSIRAFSKLLDPTFPVTSLLAGKRIAGAIGGEIKGWDIEDLWIPFFCVSTNLTTASAVVHRRGDATRAIRASVSIPGVLPPVPEGGDLLVDGCVLNNLPIDLMRGMNRSGLVIAIDVVAPRGIYAKSDYGLSVSGWRQLWNRILPWRRKSRTPDVSTVILQSTMVGSEQTRRRVLHERLADYYQNIHVQGVGMLQFDAIPKVSSIGYAASKGPLAQWVASGFPPGTMVAAKGEDASGE